jgi:ribosomal protein L36
MAMAVVQKMWCSTVKVKSSEFVLAKRKEREKKAKVVRRNPGVPMFEMRR